MTNGEPLVVRAAMKPLPTLMRPLRSVDLATGEPAEALVERSDVAAVEALAVVAEAAVAWELARAAREKFGGDAIGDMLAAHRRVPASASRGDRARPAPRARRLHGRGQDDARAAGRASGSAAPFVDLDARDRATQSGTTIPSSSIASGEAAFRELEERRCAPMVARRAEPAVIALGGGAVDDGRPPRGARGGAHSPSWLEVDVDDGVGARRAAAPGRSRATRPSSGACYEERQPALRERRRRGRAATSTTSCSPRAASTSRPARSSGSASSCPGDGPVGARRRPPRRGHPRRRRAARARRAPRLGRTSSRRARTAKTLAVAGGSGTSSRSTAAARSSRSAAAASPTWPGFVAATLPARRALGRRPDDARRPGRRGDRRQDRRSTLTAGKNRVGAFHWPARTVIDPALLATLPAGGAPGTGMAEVVKTGLLAGEPLWELPDAELVRRARRLQDGRLPARPARSTGERAVLNLGHTFAHALETASGYRLRHGDAVALGLTAALRLSEEHLGLEQGWAERVTGLLRPQPVTRRPRAARARRCGATRRRVGGRVRLVLLEAPGRPVVTDELPEAAVDAALDELIAG